MSCTTEIWSNLHFTCLLYLQLLNIQRLQIINNGQDLCRWLKLSYIGTVCSLGSNRTIRITGLVSGKIFPQQGGYCSFLMSWTQRPVKAIINWWLILVNGRSHIILRWRSMVSDNITERFASFNLIHNLFNWFTVIDFQFYPSLKWPWKLQKKYVLVIVIWIWRFVESKWGFLLFYCIKILKYKKYFFYYYIILLWYP